MIYKLTIKKDTPDFKAGEVFYLRGDKVSGYIKDAYWHEDKKVTDLRYKPEWADVEKTDLKDDRPHLSEIVKMELLTAIEAFKKLEWNYEEEAGGKMFPMCCGKRVYMSGFLGSTDRAICEVCGKNMQNMAGMFMTSSVTVSSVDEDYQADDGKIWAINVLSKKE